MDLKCPCCEKGFSGKTRQARLNSHCKASHFAHYRQHIRPLKDVKQVNHDAYVRRKQKDPGKVRNDRLMARMRKRATKEQVDLLRLGVHAEIPPVPVSVDMNIDQTNPFYVVEFILRVFIGLTFKELISFDIISTLERALTSLAAEESESLSHAYSPQLLKHTDAILQTTPPSSAIVTQDTKINLSSLVGNALAIARSSEDLHSLALAYYKYRQAIHESEFYEERLQSYKSRQLTQEARALNPGHYVDHGLVEIRAAELVAEYKPKKRSGGGTAAGQRGDKPGSVLCEEADQEWDEGDEEEEEGEEELELLWPVPRVDHQLPNIIPDSDREHSPEL